MNCGLLSFGGRYHSALKHNIALRKDRPYINGSFLASDCISSKHYGGFLVIVTFATLYLRVFKAKKQASPLEYGCEYRSVLEKQAHEHEESLRRELVSRGRGHPAKDIYIPGIRHKTEIKWVASLAGSTMTCMHITRFYSLLWFPSCDPYPGSTIFFFMCLG